MNIQFKPLQSDFYSQPALEVAPLLLGKIVHCNNVSLIITETEAYLPSDSACHAYKGKTDRNSPMFKCGGILYVYLCYGIHHLCNVVVDREGVASAVLLRAAQVYAGEQVVRERRKGRLNLVGPGKVGQALNLTPQDSGRTLSGDVVITEGFSPAKIDTAPRVGIEYALPRDRDAHWRFIANEFTDYKRSQGA